MVLDSKVLEAENPLQDMDAGDNPQDMGMHVLKYAAFVVVVLAGLGLGNFVFDRLKSVAGVSADASIPVGGEL